MGSIFTQIIEGRLPAHFVWKDEQCVAFLSIAPLRPGHTLVVPRVEVDHWIDLEPDLVAHLARVGQTIGRALQRVYSPTKVGTMIAGLEVPHVHLHLVPIWNPTDLDFANADHRARPEALAREAEKVRAALRALNASGVFE